MTDLRDTIAAERGELADMFSVVVLSRRRKEGRVTGWDGLVLPGTVLPHAGSAEATERTLAAASTRPDDTHRTLRWI